MAKTPRKDVTGSPADSKRDSAMERAKAKSARLRLLKERNENYLAEREVDEDLELRVATAD